ncbi:hypothetical protein P7K49_002206 [Saguinus oedipus]|uniref:Uncharacterized protein n=1 Tax=Saguinus oedipus TaxID=9490 RepID=A0ABQ9WH66_SAGOE|nr:hypothetical protein P7K49_002206 [Saguinus oedipus]
MLAEQMTRVNRSRADASPTCWPVVALGPAVTSGWLPALPAWGSQWGPGASQGQCNPLSPTDPEPGSPWALPATPPLYWLVSKFAPWQWAYLLITTNGLPPPPPTGSQAPKSPNQPISCLEHVSQGPLSPKTFLRCPAPEEAPGGCTHERPCRWLQVADLCAETPDMLANGTWLQLARVPAGVLRTPGLRHFYCYTRCGKVFWDGSHLGRVATHFRDILESAPGPCELSPAPSQASSSF